MVLIIDVKVELVSICNVFFMVCVVEVIVIFCFVGGLYLIVGCVVVEVEVDVEIFVCCVVCDFVEIYGVCFEIV